MITAGDTPTSSSGVTDAAGAGAASALSSGWNDHHHQQQKQPPSSLSATTTSSSSSSATTTTNSTTTTTPSSSAALQRVKGLAAAATQAWNDRLLQRQNHANESHPEDDEVLKMLQQPDYLSVRHGRATAMQQPNQPQPSLAHDPSALAKFDACVDAADALAAASSSTSDNRSRSRSLSRSDSNRSGNNRSATTTTVKQLVDCSVLVSPDGDLLLMPQGDRRSLFAKKATTTTSSSSSSNNNNNINRNNNSSRMLGSPTKKNDSDNNNSSSGSPMQAQRQAMFDELFNGKDDYESAVFLGYDLDTLGDKALNRFTAKGWSLPATTLALQQTEQTIHDWMHFCEQLVLLKKETAARMNIVCDALKASQQNTPSRHVLSTPLLQQQAQQQQYCLDDAQDWECIDPPHPHRVGPFLAPESSLFQAVQAMEQYYASIMAESEANRWRLVTMQKGWLPQLRQASQSVADRVAQRQTALDQSYQRTQDLQSRLDKFKAYAERKWEAVYQAEDRVTQKVQDILTERSWQREQRRLEEMQRAEQERVQKDAMNGTVSLGATTEEIWNIVSSVAESMDSGSFEPMDVPTSPVAASKAVVVAPPTLSLSQSDAGNEAVDAAKPEGAIDAPVVSATSTASSTLAPTESAAATDELALPALTLPVASREQIELEMGLPALRAAAMAADDAVADAADALMGLLSSLDTTRRSARVAAETCLLSAGQAQAASIKALIKLERQSLEEKLRKLKVVEDCLENIDVRSDLDAYITADKRERGGLSHLGDDDDGGLASALAVLSSHVDGSMGSDSMSRLMGSSQDLSTSDLGDEATSELLDEYVEKIFESSHNEAFAANASSDSEEHRTARKEFEDAIAVLCKTASGTGSSARAKRSAICYALNSKRSTHAEIATKVQFDALCRLFQAILTGCNAEGSNVSTAKMCIMLAQTFYLPLPSSEANSQDGDSSELGSGNGDDARGSQRLYVKSRLKNHPIWSKDSFWYV